MCLLALLPLAVELPVVAGAFAVVASLIITGAVIFGTRKGSGIDRHPEGPSSDSSRGGDPGGPLQRPEGGGSESSLDTRGTQ